MMTVEKEISYIHNRLSNIETTINAVMEFEIRQSGPYSERYNFYSYIQQEVCNLADQIDQQHQQNTEEESTGD
jgi:hypothetical protein